MVADIFVLDIEQDSSITVAFDDIPDEGLNSPLRLEKVANEVHCFKFSKDFLLQALRDKLVWDKCLCELIVSWLQHRGFYFIHLIL